MQSLIDGILDRLGGIPAVAALTRCSPQAVHHWRRTGIPAHRYDTLLAADQTMTVDALDAANAEIRSSAWICEDAVLDLLQTSEEFAIRELSPPVTNGEALYREADVYALLHRIGGPQQRAERFLQRAEDEGAKFYVDRYCGLPEAMQQSLEDHWPAINEYLNRLKQCGECRRYVIDEPREFYCIEHRAAASAELSKQIALRYKARRGGKGLGVHLRSQPGYSTNRWGLGVRVIDADGTPADPSDIPSVAHESAEIREIRAFDAALHDETHVGGVSSNGKLWGHRVAAPLTPEQRAKVAEVSVLIAGGMSENKAAKQVGVSRSTLQNWIKKQAAEVATE